MKEQRKFVRLDMSADVQWSRVSDASSAAEDKKDVTKNISAGGICLIVYEKLQAGDKLNLEIAIPSKKNIHAVGQVVWTSDFAILAEGQQERYDVGIEFVQISDADRAAIKECVFTFMQEGRKV